MLCVVSTELGADGDRKYFRIWKKKQLHDAEGSGWQFAKNRNPLQPKSERRPPMLRKLKCHAAARMAH